MSFINNLYLINPREREGQPQALWMRGTGRRENRKRRGRGRETCEKKDLDEG